MRSLAKRWIPGCVYARTEKVSVPGTRLNRWFFLVISAFSYTLGALTISWAMAKMFNESTLDQAGVRYWAILFAVLVWILGPAFASVTIFPAKQLRWWPISILFAALHGGTVVLAVSLVGSGGRPSIESAGIFSLIGAVAAALSYTYFLTIVRLIGQRAADILPDRTGGKGWTCSRS